MAKKAKKCASCKQTITIYYSDKPKVCKKCADAEKGGEKDGNNS